MISKELCWVLRGSKDEKHQIAGRQDMNPVTSLQSRMGHHNVEKVKHRENLVEFKSFKFSCLRFCLFLPFKRKCLGSFFTCARWWSAENLRPCEISLIPCSAFAPIFHELLCHQRCIWNGIYCVGGETMESYFCSNYENCFLEGRGEANRRQTLSGDAPRRRY